MCIRDSFSATLTGAKEVPPNASAAGGFGTVTLRKLNGFALVSLETSGITGTAASLRMGALGASGPVVLNLSQVSPTSWSGGGQLGAPVVSALESGGCYL